MVQRKWCDLHVGHSSASLRTECLQRPPMPKMSSPMILWGTLDESIHTFFLSHHVMRLMIDWIPQSLNVQTDLNIHTPPTEPTSENMGNFLAKSTTRVMAGVMILVNSLKASRSTLSPSEVGTIGPWPMSSGWKEDIAWVTEPFVAKMSEENTNIWASLLNEDYELWLKAWDLTVGLRFSLHF